MSEARNNGTTGRSLSGQLAALEESRRREAGRRYAETLRHVAALADPSAADLDALADAAQAAGKSADDIDDDREVLDEARRLAREAERIPALQKPVDQARRALDDALARRDEAVRAAREADAAFQNVQLPLDGAKRARGGLRELRRRHPLLLGEAESADGGGA